MARGAKPGERRGGRGKGVPNRINRERIEAFRASGKTDPFDSTIELHEHALKAHRAACKALAAYEKANRKALALARVAPEPTKADGALTREAERLAEEVDRWHARVLSCASTTMPYLHPRLASTEANVSVTSHEQALNELDDEEG